MHGHYVDESQAAAAAATAQLEAVMHDSGVGSVRTHRDGMTSSASTSSDTHEAVMAKAVTIIKKQDALTQTLGKIVDAGGVTSKKEFQTITNEHRTVVEQLEKNAVCCFVSIDKMMTILVLGGTKTCEIAQ
jgi:hypothetical protein